PEFKQTILDRQNAWREVIATAAKTGIPVPAFSASLDYFDSYRRASLPQNLTQAQRDYFGAHTYMRTDKDGIFHSEWTQLAKESLQISTPEVPLAHVEEQEAPREEVETAPVETKS
ncbi:MAG: NADP-dependent phosphogluconate dehydrogenase, partial [Microcoleus sp. SIO2G3]|nr:NADP-dependent phosphogluconate dehydrogenase [Microcoleus sp. SIO2G3]